MTKIALITGGSRGLGKSMALHLAEKGRDVILTYHSNKDRAEAVVQTIQTKGQKAAFLQLDVTRTETFAGFAQSVQSALQNTWGRTEFDFLVNNAGTGIHKPFMETTEDEFMKMMREHIKAPFFLSQTMVPFMKKGGRILNVSSGLTRLVYPGYTAYAIMKAAVEELTLFMAKELGPRGIAVNTIAPGAIETDFGGGVVRDNKEVNDHIAATTALGRAGLPDDIGGAVAALFDDGAGWINGQRIEVSGGQGI
ncbi:SDR family NAD(P)-dependent oxidoreductase [Desulfovibrio inopinatus]|uniref:SDR family NAD(P)-dependent oxidoreductase n=1 Tax=Desulfovibrio inopinatus TaxID=102109 RepID=UPI00040FAA75|nr:SDR family oxidoreductase [Desulfovibrio inopinatus]